MENNRVTSPPPRLRDIKTRSPAKSQSNATSELKGPKHGSTVAEVQIFVGFTFSEYGKLTDSNKRLILIIKDIYDKKYSA